MSQRSHADERFVLFRATGDPQAIADVYDATAGELLRIAQHWAPGNGEDLVQATFLLAIERAASFDPECPVLPWLIAILHTQARTLRRQQRRVFDGDRVALPAPTGPAEHAQGAELSAMVTAAIEHLPPAYRPVLRLHLRFGFNTPEIAQALGRPVGTVRTQLVRGRSLLRRGLPAGLTAVLLVDAAPASMPLGLRTIRAAVVAHAARHRPRAPLAPPFRATGRLIAAGGALLALACGLAATRDGVLRPGATAVAAVEPLTRTAVEERPAGTTRPPHRTPLGEAPLPARVTMRYADDGAPAGGVWVRLRPVHRPNPFLHERWLQSDERGALPADPLLDEPVLVDVDRGVQARIEPAQPMAITIPRGYEVNGQVVDATGRAAPGARIWLSTPSCDTEGHEAARADGDGRFRLRALTGPRFLAADTAHFAVQEMVEIDGAPGDTCTVTLRLTAECGRVCGTVLGPDGAPIHAARIIAGEELFARFGTSWAPRVGWTDAAGRFDLTGVPAGPTVLAARAPGLQAAAVSIHVRRGERVEHMLRLDAAAEIHGWVRTADGQPIAGAWVGCLRGEDWTASGVHSDEHGRYRLTDVAPNAEVWVRHARWGIAHRRFADLAATPHEWNPVLDRQAAPLCGTLATADGEPLHGWRLWFVPQDRRTLDPRLSGLVAHTAADGGFTLPFAKSTPHGVYATPPGQPFRCRIDAVATPGDPVRLRVPRTQLPVAGVRGRVTDPFGVPIAGARLLLTQPDSLARLPFGATADGVFARTALAPGPYELQIRAPGFAARRCANLELTAAATLDLGGVVLARAAPVTLEIHRADHRPVEGRVHVRIRGENGEQDDVVMRSDRWLAELAPGRYVAEGIAGAMRIDTCFVVGTKSGTFSLAEPPRANSSTSTCLTPPPPAVATGAAASAHDRR